MGYGDSDYNAHANLALLLRETGAAEVLRNCIYPLWHILVAMTNGFFVIPIDRRQACIAYPFFRTGRVQYICGNRRTQVSWQLWLGFAACDILTYFVSVKNFYMSNFDYDYDNGWERGKYWLAYPVPTVFFRDILYCLSAYNSGTIF